MKVYRATKEIADEFEKRGLKFQISFTAEMSYVEASFVTERAGVVKFLFLSNSDEGDVALRAYNVLRDIPAEKRARALEAVNGCNRRLRFAKFALDDDGSIDAEYDFPSCAVPLGEMACELAIRFTQVLDEAYPQLAEALGD